MDWCLLLVLCSKYSEINRCNMVLSFFLSSSTQRCSKWTKWKVSSFGVIISRHIPMPTEPEVTSRWATTCWQIITAQMSLEWSFHQGPATSFMEVDKDINIHKWQTNTSKNLLVIISYPFVVYFNSKGRTIRTFTVTLHSTSLYTTFYMVFIKQYVFNARTNR